MADGGGGEVSWRPKAPPQPLIFENSLNLVLKNVGIQGEGRPEPVSGTKAASAHLRAERVEIRSEGLFQVLEGSSLA